jgi:hypothetical protein
VIAPVSRVFAARERPTRPLCFSQARLAMAVASGGGQAGNSLEDPGHEAREIFLLRSLVTEPAPLPRRRASSRIGLAFLLGEPERRVLDEHALPFVALASSGELDDDRRPGR